MTDGATSTNANGFFGASLKFSGYDAIVIQGQAEEAVLPLHQRRRGGDPRRAAPQGQGHLGDAAGAGDRARPQRSPHERVRARAWRGRIVVRFAAIHGDYGHVASKNGCGAVMGKKRLKAVCIVRGTGGLPCARSARAGAGRGRHRARPQDRSRHADAVQLGHPARRLQPVQARRAAHQELHHQPHHAWTWRSGSRPSCAGASTTAGISAMPAACTTATSRSSATGSMPASGWTSRSTRAGRGAGWHDRAHRQGRDHLAQYAAGPRLRGRQRVRLGMRLGDGVLREGLPHREAGRVPPQRGATPRGANGCCR